MKQAIDRTHYGDVAIILRQLASQDPEYHSRLMDMAIALDSMWGDDIPDFNDVWGGAGPDNHSTPIEVGGTPLILETLELE